MSEPIPIEKLQAVADALGLDGFKLETRDRIYWIGQSADALETDMRLCADKKALEIIDGQRIRIKELERQLAEAQAPTREPVAWIEHHKGGDNLNWERVDHAYAKATPLFRALPIESAPMRRDQKLAAAGIKPRPLLNALRKDESATPADHDEGRQVKPHRSGGGQWVGPFDLSLPDQSNEEKEDK